MRRRRVHGRCRLHPLLQPGQPRSVPAPTARAPRPSAAASAPNDDHVRVDTAVGLGHSRRLRGLSSLRDTGNLRSSSLYIANQ